MFMVAVWRHECERVFLDKLVNENDKNKAKSKININCSEQFPFLKDFPDFWTKEY